MTPTDPLVTMAGDLAEIKSDVKHLRKAATSQDLRMTVLEHDVGALEKFKTSFVIVLQVARYTVGPIMIGVVISGVSLWVAGVFDR